LDIAGSKGGGGIFVPELFSQIRRPLKMNGVLVWSTC